MNSIARPLWLLLLFAAMSTPCVAAHAAGLQSDWGAQIDRPWPGTDYWANPVKDWRLRDGQMVCMNPAENRNIHLLTRALGEKKGDLRMSVRATSRKGDGPKDGFVGFRIAQGQLDDYRNTVLTGRGLEAGLTNDGRLFLGNPAGGEKIDAHETVTLRLSAEPDGDRYKLTLTAEHDGETIGRVTSHAPTQRMHGNLVLVAHRARPGSETSFADWRVEGSKVVAHEDRAFGPVLFAMHTLSRNVMKMTAQMAPVGHENNRAVELQIKKRRGDWQTIDRAEIDEYARTARFRVEEWDGDRDVPYRIVYILKDARGGMSTHCYTGTVRQDPADQDDIVVAGFTGHKDYLFPNSEVVAGVEHHDPDVLVFTGDQYYEDSGGYGIERNASLERLSLDLLQHWVLLGWSFGDLMRDRPTLCLPDDHDVYQGNIWGAAGRPVDHIRDHPEGGYAMDADWVNVVERCQTSHLPDPYDPTPVHQNIGVYYCDMLYGRVSFAVFEDRKFKSGPKGLVPPTDTNRPDHIKSDEFDVSKLDVPEAVLLGDRQLEFLDHWVADWRGADMKCAVSQTLFAQVPNIHGGNQQRLAADLDSNGWPRTPRDNALYTLRKGFAFHLSGDQHLPMIVHYGVDEYGDAPYTLCVPSITAGYPRAFRPDESGRNAPKGAPDYVGNFLDGLGNKMTVHAVANPPKKRKANSLLEQGNERRSGYAIVRFHKLQQKITLESWPMLSDPANDEQQMVGWPKTIDMADNYGRQPRAHLPTITVEGMSDPVAQVINEHSGRVVYTRRYRGTKVKPAVFQNHYKHTVRIGEPGTERWKTLKHLEPGGDAVTVSF